MKHQNGKDNGDDNENVIKLIRKRDILKIYCKSVIINFWVLLKSLFQFIKDEILYNTRKIVEIDAASYPDKPPSCLMDNKLGRHSYVKLKNTKLHYVESGRENSNVVLLLHGFPDCWLGWRYQIPALSQYYRVIALDLKGFNDSEKPTWRTEYKPKVICEELEQFIQALGVPSVTIIGHDLGALIGWTFAYLYPKSVEKFISVSTPHSNLIWDDLPGCSVMNQTWFDFVQLPIIPEMELVKTGDKFLSKFYSHLAREKLYCPADLKETTASDIWEAYKYVFSQTSDWNGALNYYRNFLFYRIVKKDLLRCPCLVVIGNEDNFYKLESIVKSGDLCDNYTIKIIQDTGHFPHQQNSAVFNKIILSYLVGKRLHNESISDTESSRSAKSLMNRTFGAVSNGVKFGGKELIVHALHTVFMNSIDNVNF